MLPDALQQSGRLVVYLAAMLFAHVGVRVTRIRSDAIDIIIIGGGGSGRGCRFGGGEVRRGGHRDRICLGNHLEASGR
eukprot:1195107-Prorocentrum_minimum.AAC.2